MIKLCECVEILDNRRIPLSSKDRENLKKIYPYYGAQGIIDYVEDYLFDGEYILVAEDGNNLKSLSESIVTWATGKFWVNNHAHILGAKEGYDLKYIYYLLQCMDLRGYITGSAQPKFNQENLANVKLELPSYDIQVKVSNTLSEIDSKIALNNSICSDLESMAKLLYDYWFIQFDFPDENGKPYKSSGGKMVWNEELKREIPEGWDVKRIGELANTNSNSLGKNQIPDVIQYLDTANLTDNRINEIQTITKEDGIPSRAQRLVKAKDVLFSTVRPNQHHFGIIENPVGTLIASTGFAVFSMKASTDNNYWLYLSITCDSHMNILETIANSSVSSYPSINPSDIERLIVAWNSDRTILRLFAQKVSPFFRKIDDIHSENQQLSSLRDFLLPMLMNGQVKVGKED